METKITNLWRSNNGDEETTKMETLKREERRQNKKINQRIERDKGIEVTNLEKEAMEENSHHE